MKLRFLALAFLASTAPLSAAGEWEPGSLQTSALDALAERNPGAATSAIDLTLDKFLAGALSQAEPGETVAWPATQKHAGGQLQRYTLYSQPAKAASQRSFFIGEVGSMRLSLAYDRGAAHVTGIVVDGQRAFRILPSAPGQRLQLESLTVGREGVSFECGLDAQDLPPDLGFKSAALEPVPAKGSVLSAPLAFEYDAEWLAGKGNSQAQARTWIEDLVVAMNVYYPNDLGLRLQIAAIVTPGGANHPVFAPNLTGANSSSLNAVGSHWSTHHAAISRVFSVFLSGREIPTNSFSGFASVFDVNTYCSPANGNSINLVGTSGLLDPEFMSLYIGHEIGHNAGSRHTHCEALGAGGAFVDQCYNQEGSSCYQGTTACPEDDCGTIMSYCHFPESSGGPVGNTSFSTPCATCDNPPRFHPLIQNKIREIMSRVPSSCLAPEVVSPPTAADRRAVSVRSMGVAVTLRSEEPDGDTVSFSITQQPSNGSLSAIGAPVRNGNVVTATVTYTPDGNFEGDDRFSYSATDKDGSATGRVDVKVARFLDGFETM